MPFHFPTPSSAATPTDGGKRASGRSTTGLWSLPRPVLFCLLLAFCWPAAKVQGFTGRLASTVAVGRTERPEASPSRLTMHHLGDFPVRDNGLRLLLDREYYPALSKALDQAKSEISMAMFLFKINRSVRNRPAKILAKLAAARRRGVRVEVVLERSSYDEELNRENRKTARLLRRRGIRVRFDRGKETTHTKLVVIDRRYCFIGSHNLTQAALKYNHEASVVVDSRELARKLLRYIKGL